MKSNLVYIAAPYRSQTEDGVYENIQAVRSAAKRLWKARLVPVCPHLNSAFMGGVVPDSRFIEGDLEILRAVAAAGGVILLVGDWLNSEGCQQENHVAATLGMRCFQTVEGLLSAKAKG